MLDNPEPQAREVHTLDAMQPRAVPTVLPH